MNKRYRFLYILIMMMLVFSCCTGVMAESYEASTMRLLKYVGTVEILDASDNSRFVMENARFSSGETLKTGSDGSASISLDSTKIVSLDADTTVKFAQDSGHMKMTLSEGTMLLDVREKLDENETLDIQTATMMVGIRGTIILVKQNPDITVPEDVKKNTEGERTTLNISGNALSNTQPDAELSSAGKAYGAEVAVLTGVVELTFQENDTKRQMKISAGQKATIINDSEPDAVPVVSEMTVSDLEGFVAGQIQKVPEIRKRIEEESPAVRNLLDELTNRPVQEMDKKEASDDEESEKYKIDGENLFPKDGDWTYNGEVTIVAQSASKLYDGTPLMYPTDVLVSGLPEYFKADITVSGSQTNVGSSANKIVRYAIMNDNGEDVTDHFSDLKTVDGTLTVAPTQLTVWTEGAEKVYDGTPLVNTNAFLRSSPGQLPGQPGEQTGISAVSAGTIIRTAAGSSAAPAWRNSSLVVTNTLEKEILYGTSGVVWVHSTNPVTLETKDIELRAGERLEIILHNNNTAEESIEFSVTPVKENQIPDEVLRLYAENESLLKQACIDAGWDQKIIDKRIEDLKDVEQTIVEKSGLKINKEQQDKLMVDSTDVRLNIDTDLTNYNDCSISSDEAHFAPVYVPHAIDVKATGS